MEATQAGIIINNSNNIVLSINTAIMFSIGLPLVGSIAGIIISIIGKIGDGYINEFFSNRNEKRTKKLEAARDINAFCVEGMKIGFRHKPKDEGHILLRATEIEAIDQEVGKKLRVFLSSWMQYRTFLKENTNEVEREKLAIEFKNDAQNYGDDLLKTARIWAQ